MRITTIALVGLCLATAACTDIVSREPGKIAIAVPSAYKIDTAKRRADRYCEDQTGGHASLIRTENDGHSDVAYFECR